MSRGQGVCSVSCCAVPRNNLESMVYIGLINANKGRPASERASERRKPCLLRVLRWINRIEARPLEGVAVELFCSRDFLTTQSLSCPSTWLYKVFLSRLEGRPRWQRQVPRGASPSWLSRPAHMTWVIEYLASTVSTDLRSTGQRTATRARDDRPCHQVRFETVPMPKDAEPWSRLGDTALAATAYQSPQHQCTAQAGSLGNRAIPVSRGLYQRL